MAFDSVGHRKTWMRVSLFITIVKNGGCESIVFRFPGIENRK